MDHKVLQSEKLNVIDQPLFQRILDNDVNNQQRQIKNSKYKKTRNEQNFDLMSYLIQPHSSQRQRKKRKKPSLKINRKPIKKHGKVREHGRKKKRTKLKRSILRQRQLRLLRRLENERETETKGDLAENEKQMDVDIDEMTKTLAGINLAISEDNPIIQSPSVDMKPIEPPNPYIKHSRSFRNYCDNYPNTNLCNLTNHLLRTLNKFQRRAFSNNPLRAQAHRRLVIGFHEVQSHLNIKKVKLVIIAPDIENSDGLNETIASIKMQCNNENIPYIFSLNRRGLAYSLFKRASISCVGILDYDGARDIFQNLITSLYEARALYNKLTEAN